MRRINNNIDHGAKKKPIKRRLFIAITMLIVVAVMLGIATYAWYAISFDPSVKTISMAVESNGVLEIALLSSDTYEDLSQIQSGIGSSMDVSDPEIANGTWGNLVELSRDSYGLNLISLVPSVLNISKYSSGAASIGSSILQVPSFGYDGRVKALDVNSVSGILGDDGFTVNTAYQTHGVRAIGSADTFTLQQKILLTARSSVISSCAVSKQSAEQALLSNGKIVFELWNRRHLRSDYTITAEDMDSLHALANDTENCLDDIEYTIRQGLIAIITSEIEDKAQFKEIYEIISNTEMPLSRALDFLPFSFSGSAAISNWVDEIDEAAESVRYVADKCEELTASELDWENVGPLLNVFVDMNKVYCGSEPFSSTQAFLYGAAFTVMPGSGVLSLISDYVGQYSAYVAKWTGEPVQFDHEIIVRTENSSGYLSILSGIVSNLEAAGNTGLIAKITDICGFAIDLAFRVNTEGASLLFKSVATVYDDPINWDGGSYIEFKSEQFEEEPLLELMNTVRVTFVNVDGTVLGMAKLNLGDAEETEDGFRAPLYIYDYSYTVDSVTVEDRLDNLSKLCPMPKNVPVIVTAIVWMDGNSVDNSMIAGSGTSVSAKINLQFATDAALVPAQ